MSVPSTYLPRWSTSSIAEFTDSASTEQGHLESHLSSCSQGRGSWFAVRCVADAVHDFVAPRFVTTLCLAAALIAVVSTFG